MTGTTGKRSAGAAVVGLALGVALATGSCGTRDADVPVRVRFPDASLGTPILQGVQSFRLSVRKGTPGGADMKVLSEKIVAADAASVSFRGMKGGTDRFVVLEGLDLTAAEIEAGGTPVVLARGSTVPDAYLPPGEEPPTSGSYGTEFLFVGRVGEMSALDRRLQEGRAFFGSAALPNGGIALAGGIGKLGGGLVALTNVVVFDRSELAFVGGGLMTSARAYPVAVALGSKGVLVGGGVAILSTSMAPLATAERLDEHGIPLGRITPRFPRLFQPRHSYHAGRRRPSAAGHRHRH